jgi:hypothetical protein
MWHRFYTEILFFESILPLLAPKNTVLVCSESLIS